MRHYLAGILVAALSIGLAADVVAQGRGGRGGFGGRAGGMGGMGGVGRTALLRIESVQEELGLEDVQVEDIRAMQREMRGQRGDRPNYRDMSDEERREAFAQMREEATERQKQETEKIADILDSDQMQRLNGIFAQVAGPAALMDSLIGEKLGVTDEQRDELQQISRDAMEDMRDTFQAGDREGMRARMEEFRANIEKESMAVLTDGQREELVQLKGDPFELSDEDLASVRGGRGGRGGRDGGGQRRGRPQLEE